MWEFDVPREALWRYVADTDWVNEHAGLPRISVRFEPNADGAGSRRFASFGKGPFAVEWEELPTVWQVPNFYAVERRYSKGPLARFVNRTALEVAGSARTRIVVDLQLYAASPLVEPLLPLLAAHGKRGANRAFALAAKLAANDAARIREDNGASLGPFAVLPERGVDPRVARALARMVETAADRDLARMRPYELADRWGLPRREVLRGFLAATRAGAFNLSWSVMCSSCRGPTQGMASLESLERGYHCPACNLAFDAVFDRSVEVTFDARPLGRAAAQGMFCIASPQRSSHVYMQCAPAASSSASAEALLPAGSYDVNAIGIGRCPFIAADDEPVREVRTLLRPDRTLDLPQAVGTGALHFTVVNAMDRDAVVRIEDGRWPDTIATAAQVTALQEFRDLFSSQVLSHGLELAIETMAVLFTDVVGSTAMYSKSGDAPAFRLVTDHFDVLTRVVSEHEGAIVKTIGDAIMAVFVDPVHCLNAALELDGSVRHILHEGMRLQLRVGFHAGPCIAIRANDRIDYFGTTVNLAARLQALAQAAQVTLSRSVADRPDVAARLKVLPVRAGYESVAIKGFAQAVDVVRLTKA
jgi:class 3 adenylate cyclase